MIVSLLRWSGVMPPTSLSVLSTPEKRFLHFHFLWVSCLKRSFALPNFHAERNSISTKKQLICTFTFMAIQQSHINTRTFFLHFYFHIPLSASKFASYFGNYNSIFWKFWKFWKFWEKIPIFRICFSKISKTTKGQPLTSKGPPPPC